MRKPDFNRVLWFGAEKFPPIKTKWFFFSRRDVSNFRPYDISYQRLVCQTTATRDFIHEVSLLMQALQPNIISLLEQYGVVVAPVNNIYETVEDTANPEDEFRGMPDRDTWGTIGGACGNDGHLITLTEFLLEDGLATRNVDFASAFTHEVAHTLDEAFDLFSESPEFFWAWKKDKESLELRLSAQEREELAYYLADAPQGNSEVFAEISSNLIGKGLHDCNWRYWYRRFPRCYRLVAKFWRYLPDKLPVLSNTAALSP